MTLRAWRLPGMFITGLKPVVSDEQLRGSADCLFEVLQLPWMQSSKLHLICKATRHLAYALMKYADYLYPSTEVVPSIIYTTEYWIPDCQQYRV